MTGHLAGVKEGDVLAQKYRVERVLGVGGMGVVVAAHHLELDERVALKFMPLPDCARKMAVAELGTGQLRLRKAWAGGVFGDAG